MEKSQLLLDWLIARYPTAKRQTLKRMLEDGRVTINGQIARRLKEPLQEGDVVRISERVERPSDVSIEPLKVIHEDDEILVVNKPAGLLTSTVAREWRPTAIALVRRYLADRQPQARAGVIHRLDRDASGLLVFSKSHAAYQSLKQQFFVHSVERVYTAVVHGCPRERAGRIESYLVELPDGSMRSTRDSSKGQHAMTDYQVIKEAGELSVLRVTLQTGRKHQIRAHMSQRGMPIVGDSVYGREARQGGRLLLAATTLAIDHPRTGKRMKFELPPPREIQSVLDQ